MTCRINVADVDLAATLGCGQAFRWSRDADGWWTGVVGAEVWRVRQDDNVLWWEAADPHPDPLPDMRRGEGMPSPLPRRLWERPAPLLFAGTGEGGVQRLRHYLSLDRFLPSITATFPPALRAAVRRHWGLRVLRQEPWETLASFLASSTKQIVQIRQIVELLAQRFGEPVGSAYRFPSAAVLARATLPELRACKLGFRAPYLLAAARAVDAGTLDLPALARRELPRAREELRQLPGVGPKIADCVLLFGCGHDAAFPVDVWMRRALQRVKTTDLGPYAGWAQQYLFHDERTRRR